MNKEQAIHRVKAYLRMGNGPHAIFAANPEKNYSLPKDRLLYETFKTADLLIPDGIGVVIAARILHGVKLTRVPGIELMEDICGLAANGKHKVFIYGGKEEVNKSATEILRRRYPGLEIVGRSNGYVREDQVTDLIDQMNRSKAEILFLALGSPKQEIWFASNRQYLENIKICQGIGGSLDIIVGNVKRAPETWRKYSAEWIYRLIAEPKRIKRQKVLPIFAMMLLISKLKTFLEDWGRS